MYFQEIIVYKIPPGGGGGSIASSRPIWEHLQILIIKLLEKFTGRISIDV